MLRTAATLAALLAADTFPEPAPEPGPNARLAARVVAAASDRVGRRWPACRFKMVEARGLTEGAVPDDLAAVVGALRRPQTPVEAALTADAFLPVGQVLRQSVRITRVLADGAQVRLLVTSDVPRPTPRPAVCRTRELRVVRTRVRGLPVQARRAALRQLRVFHEAEDRFAATPSPQPGVFVTVVDPDGLPEGVAAAGPQDLRESGAWTAIERRRGRSLLVGVVPDGVARVEVTLARGRSPWTKRRYDTAARLSGAVVDNVVAIPVSRPQEDAWMTRQVWRAADGRQLPSRLPRRSFVIVESF